MATPPPELVVTEDGTSSATHPSEAATTTETRLGRFVLLRLLGKGGMGVVYTAWDELLDRRVALKLVRADHDGNAHGRMLHEAKGLARLSHPNVVQIYEVSASAGRLFIAMEYVPGVTLRAWTAERRRTADAQRDLLNMYIQAGRGLAAAHAEGLVHRDFKPDNVLVGDDGRARVADFGLVAIHTTARAPDLTAAVAPYDINERLTVHGAILGTPAYMSPEQFAGRPADARSDQFSFCAALYEALCGVRPFAGATVTTLRAEISAGTLQPPPADAALPAWLLRTLRRGLAARPEDRFPAMDALIASLVHDPVARRRRRLRAALLILAVAVTAALLVLLAVDLRQRLAARQREHDAERARVSAEARIAEARAAADHPAAREVFAAFVADPLHADTTALAQAWLDEAARRRDDGAVDEARAAYAAAYVQAPAPTLQTRALRGLADVLRAGHAWDGVARLLALQDREHPAAHAEFADLRLAAALARRDLAAAHDLAAAGPLAPLTASLRPATLTAHRHIVRALVGADHIALIEHRDDHLALHVVRRDPALTPIYSAPLPAGLRGGALIPGDPLHYVASTGSNEHNTLYRVDPDRLVQLHRWSGPSVTAGAAADLDGDGARELYLGTGMSLEVVRVDHRPDGGLDLTVVYDQNDTLRSLLHGLTAADLDGDGRDELAAVFTGWLAHDLRVLQAAPDGHLVAAGRDKLGTMYGVATLRAADGGARTVVRNVNHDRSTLVFPQDRPRGEPEGLYLHRFAAGQLTRTLHRPLGVSEDNFAYKMADPIIGDLDGDGRDDVAIDHDDTVAVHTLVLLQTATGEFVQAPLGHLQILATAELDGDPASELIARLPAQDGTPQLWIVGAGTDTLPPVPLPQIHRDVLVDPEDPAWSRQWRQAAALRDLGLDADAADAFEQLARRSPVPLLRARSALAAGRLRERSNQHPAALTLLHTAARAPELAAEALQAALPLELRLGDYTAAATTLASLRATGDAPDPRLADVIDRAAAEHLELRFDAPLDPAWRLPDPLALRREPGGDGLQISTNHAGELLSLPVHWSGDLAELAADITYHETEFGLRINILLTSDDDPAAPPLLAAHAGLSGNYSGDIAVERVLACDVDGVPLETPARPDFGRPHLHSLRVTTRVAGIPALGEIVCDLAVPSFARTFSQHTPLVGALKPAGNYRLVVATNGDTVTWSRFTLHRLSLRGFTRVPAPPGHTELERTLVDGDPHALLVAQADTALTPREQVWRAHALLQVGRGAEARTLLADLLALADPPPDLAWLLRAHPELYAPMFRELAGPRYLQLVHTAWLSTAANHLDDPRPRRALLGILAPLDADEILADPTTVLVAHDLLRWRADILARNGDLPRARADLTRVLAARLPPDSRQARYRWRVCLDLASLAARAGDLDPARSAVRDARASSKMPMLVDDIVRARPELAALTP